MSTNTPPRKHVRVAIVGSGLTGLVATYLLSAHDTDSPNAPIISVEIFERADTLGMDSASISVPLPLSPSTQTPTPTPPQPAPTSASSDNDGLRSRSHKRLKVEPPSISGTAASQSHLRIDVPMRAFTGGYYPQLLALYRHLGIRTKKTNFTYSFASLPATATPSSSCSTRSSSPDWHAYASSTKASSDWDPSIDDHTPSPSPSILYNGANGVRGVSLPSSLRNPRLPSPITISNVVTQVSRLRAYFGLLILLVLGYLQLLIIALWHHTLGHTCEPTHPLRTLTLRDLVNNPFPVRSPKSQTPTAFTRRIRYAAETTVETLLRKLVGLDERFAEQTLTPLFSAVMTSTLESVWNCPASEVLDYVALTLGKDHFVVKDGVRTVVAALLTHVSHPAKAEVEEEKGKVWTGAEVRSVHYRDGKAFISVVHHQHNPSNQGKEGEEMERQPSSSASDRTFVHQDDEDGETNVDVRQHGPFNHVIFATQANQTARFLRGYRRSLAQREPLEASRLDKVVEVLNRFKYEKSTVVNHTDVKAKWIYDGYTYPDASDAFSRVDDGYANDESSAATASLSAYSAVQIDI